MYKLFTPTLPLNHNKNLRWVLFLVLVELFPAPHLISHNASTSVRGQGPSYLWWQRWASQVALVAKNPPASAGDIRDARSIPGSGRPPGGGHGNPLQSSCLENPMDRGGWWATFHRVAKSQTRLKRPSMHACILSLQGRQDSHQCPYLPATLGLHSRVRSVAASTQGTSSLVGHSSHHSQSPGSQPPARTYSTCPVAAGAYAVGNYGCSPKSTRKLP